MDEYREPYLRLWRGVTGAIEAMESRSYGTAEDLLRTAQQSAKEAYVSQEDTAPAVPRLTESVYIDR